MTIRRRVTVRGFAAGIVTTVFLIVTLVTVSQSGASAHTRAVGVQGANRTLTAQQAQRWYRDLKGLAFAISPFCASKVINDRTPPGKVGGELVKRFSGTHDACTAARKLGLTALDLRRTANQRPYFGFTSSHVHRKGLPDICRLRLQVRAGAHNSVRTINASGHNGIC